MLKKFLIISIIINIILLAVIGYLLLDVGIVKANLRVSELEKQTINNSRDIQNIVNFISQNVQQNQNVQK